MRAQQIDKSPWRLGKEPGFNKFLKKKQRRHERREAKQDPANATRRRLYDGYA